MFVLKKALAPFFLPPGFLIALMLMLAAGFWAARRRSLAVFSLLVGLLWWAVATWPVGHFFSARLESGLVMPKDPKGDVIILLCGGLVNEAPDLTGLGRPTDVMMTRIVTAVRLYQKLEVPVLVTGGRVFGQKNSEAAVTKRFLSDLGVPPYRIELEERSRDTYENAKFASEMVKKGGYSKPLLVTTGLHMKRAMACFALFGTPVTPVPSSLDSQADHAMTWRDFLPGGFDSLSYALHETIGRIYYQWVYE